MGRLKKYTARGWAFNGTSDDDVWLASSLRLQVPESHSPWLLAPLPLHPHPHTHHIHSTSHPFALFPHAQHLFTSHTLAFQSLVPQAHLHTPAGYHTGHPPTSLPRPTSICHTPPIHTPRLGIEIGDDAWKLDLGPPKAQGPVIRDSTSTCQLDLLLNIVY